MRARSAWTLSLDTVSDIWYNFPTGVAGWDWPATRPHNVGKEGWFPARFHEANREAWKGHYVTPYMNDLYVANTADDSEAKPAARSTTT